MLPRNCQTSKDSGIRVPKPAAENDAAIPASSPMDIFPPSGSYGVFRLDEDMPHVSARSDRKSPEEAAHESNQSCSGSPSSKPSLVSSLNQITLPTSVVGGFRDAKIKLNIPGVNPFLLSPPDSVHVNFNISTPIEELSDMKLSDLRDLDHALAVTSWWKRRRYGSASPFPQQTQFHDNPRDDTFVSPGSPSSFP
ncbi:unnamed protein product [Mesocestoides corti]|uniref:ZU5 domain-containing protein n=1 Tax=Mesocestoides corti TaxID=53468 RepID=A0A0R3UQP7_MESCO|nr:unnamed protein product [Mesocestoides corti]